ncbi:unnamed protein product [Gongylonema pulchrum]|uniref:Pepsin inhibitor-3-like repeated domain-containing protein n=1 Tax=Gongylonema pulchrum TaxID=637853 RepID=A0A3P6P8G7_9BILA|nr:unnamed protein product [Gongylonema pulchrum]
MTIAVLEASPTRRHSKRFSGFSVAGIGGSAGCVVTGNKLFANGFFLRELTGEEQKELINYEEDSKRYKEEVKLSLEAKRKEWQQARHRKGGKALLSNSSKDLPKPPKKPSFCSASDTTQYYFDGCMVQNNKVFVGREYARDLTPEEVEELKIFDQKMTAYQKYLSATIQQQVDSLFGGKADFWSLFTDAHAKASPTTEPTTPESTTITEPVEAPPSPNFCIAIY